MKLVIDKKYLEIPVGAHAIKKKVLFYKEGKLIFDFYAAIDSKEPDYFQYINLERFSGCEFDVKINPEIEFVPKMTDEIQDDIKLFEKYRPQVHFSTRRGWINDPNGLYYDQGIYHMFFQYNPADHNWGNMHWGHAISKDLMHWTELECALYPDEMGTMFSGSAIVDKENVAGLKENENDTVLLYYTAAGNNSELSKDVKFTQCIAYSIDGGKSFVKYEKNPVVAHIEAENRDPKIIYSPEIGSYIMALYMNENRYTLFSSKNLLDWEVMQHLVLPEDSECPDFYPLPVDGKVKWVLSGAADRYLIGDIEKGKFKAVQTGKRLHYGSNSYAAQTFSNIDGRIVRVAWDTMHVPESYFNCSMCFPTEMSLLKIGGEYALCAYPIDEIRNLYTNKYSYKNTVISVEDRFIVQLNTKDTKAFDFDMLICANEESTLQINVFGMEIIIDVKENSIKCLDRNMPICMENGKIKLRIIVDSLGFELFAGEGQAFMCMGFLCDYTLDKLEMKLQGGVAELISCDVAELKL